MLERICTTCLGAGALPTDADEPDGADTHMPWRPCEDCGGSGKTPDPEPDDHEPLGRGPA